MVVVKDGAKKGSEGWKKKKMWIEVGRDGRRRGWGWLDDRIRRDTYKQFAASSITLMPLGGRDVPDT